MKELGGRSRKGGKANVMVLAVVSDLNGASGRMGVYPPASGPAG